MRRSSRRSLLLLGAASTVALSGTSIARAGHLLSSVKRRPDLTETHLSAIAAQSQENAKLRVIVIGNSATIGAGFIETLRRNAGHNVHISRASANGARLVQSVRIASLRSLLAQGHWDAVVLQDFSSTPLYLADRLGSRIAISTFARLATDARIVLFPHWPSAPGHAVYQTGGGVKKAAAVDPIDYAKRAQAHYANCADRVGATVAPVLSEWMAAMARGEPIYARDRHHASKTGAALAAGALWSALSKVFS